MRLHHRRRRVCRRRQGLRLRVRVRVREGRRRRRVRAGRQAHRGGRRGVRLLRQVRRVRRLNHRCHGKIRCVFLSNEPRSRQRRYCIDVGRTKLDVRRHRDHAKNHGILGRARQSVRAKPSVDDGGHRGPHEARQSAREARSAHRHDRGRPPRSPSST